MTECARCGRSFEQATGRGGRSPYCPECKAERRSMQQQQRSMRHALSVVSEWVDALGPTVLEWKAEVTKRQKGMCARCGETKRLYLGRDQQGLVALCQTCHEQWREERNDRGDPAGSDDDGDDGLGIGSRRAGEPASVS